MEIEIKQVKCSSCGVTLQVKNSRNEEIKLITCPKCKTQLKVRFAPRNLADIPEAHTVIGSTGPKTQLGGEHSPGMTVIAGHSGHQIAPTLMCNGMQYSLELGRNVVGRKASTSQATVQIVTSDMYMSRQHAVINVVKLPTGGVKALLSNYQNKNTTSVNATAINDGEEIVLVDGNTITMGNTTLLYKEQPL